jgi:fibronectin type 3 domain-containing protein
MKQKENSREPRRRSGALAFAFLLLLAGCGRWRDRPHSVTLTWKASTTPDVRYNVYRTSMMNGNLKTLTPQPITATQFVDSTVQSGLTYSYAVTSVDSKGIESRRSDPAVVTVPTP